MLTEEQAFKAMRSFLIAYWERGGSNPDSDLAALLGETGFHVWADGSTADPSQWSDWLAVVRAVQAGEQAS